MIEPTELLALCQETVERGRRLGADQVEVFASSRLSSEVELQKDDIHTAATEDETSFGIRVLRNGSLGFAAVNGVAQLAAACADALEIAAVAPADPHERLPEPRPVTPLPRDPDGRLAELDVERLVELAASLLRGVRQRDARVRIDGGGVSVSRAHTAIASSTGMAWWESDAEASANLFGMAVDGDDIGSFDYDSISVLRADRVEAELAGLEERFVTKRVGALGARQGESFRGALVLSPEVVRSFLLGDLLPVLSAKAVRTGRSPLADALGKSIAASGVTLVDDPRLPEGTASAAFDREGLPKERRTLIDRGVLQSFLYDSYEARRASVEPTGHACGGAGSLPFIGTSNLALEPGEQSRDALCRGADRAVWVSRLSGSSSPVSGEFSGVVKGGFLLRDGERIPIRETMIAGNLYDALRSISGISKELTDLQGSARLPAIRIEDISITAG